jgi:hypothetical protein
MRGLSVAGGPGAEKEDRGEGSDLAADGERQGKGQVEPRRENAGRRKAGRRWRILPSYGRQVQSGSGTPWFCVGDGLQLDPNQSRTALEQEVGD